MHTRTYALMAVSVSTFNEVLKNLQEAGYYHAIGADGTLDMHGLALVKMPEVEPLPTPPVKCSCRTGCKSPTCTNC